MTTFFEALEPGMNLKLGEHTFDAETITRFASRYDPQRFHLSEADARESVFGALCASGWHTVSVWMKLNIANGRSEMRRLTGWEDEMPLFGPSPGFRDLKWRRPVYAGETVRYTTTIVGTRRSASKAGWGVVTNASEGRLPDGTLVLSMNGAVLIRTD